MKGGDQAELADWFGANHAKRIGYVNRASRSDSKVHTLRVVGEWTNPELAALKSGQEPFLGTDATVSDFWAFAMSDLRMNNVRGYLAEFLVARAVGAKAVRIEWDAFDVLTPERTRVEVKSSGYLQAWAQRGPSRISFTGLRGRPWDAETQTFLDSSYNADVYVFAIETATTHEMYNPLDLSQWEFFVCSRATVEATGCKSLALSRIRAIAEGPVEYAELKDAIGRAAAEQQRAGDSST